MINKQWFDNIAKALDENVGNFQRNEIMKGYDDLNGTSSEEEVGLWLERFIEKMSEIENESLAKHIFRDNSPCNINAHPDFISRVKEIYEKSNNIEEFVNEINSQGFWNFKLENNILFTTKPFACGKGEPTGGGNCGDCTKCNDSYKSTISNKCHCWQAKLISKPVSKLYCFCGAGFYKPLFDDLWQTDTRIEPINTVIAGSNKCVFAIYIPEKIVKGCD